jgi:hypothetical protein
LSCPYFARIASGAVTSTWPIWLSAAVRALTAERAVLCRARIGDGLVLRRGLGASGQGGACGGVGVDGVGLAGAAAFGLVGAVDLDDLVSVGAGSPGEAGPVGRGAFHSDRDHPPVGGQEGQGRCVSGGGGGELRVGEVASVVADDSDVDGVGVGVDPAEHILVLGVRRTL